MGRVAILLMTLLALAGGTAGKTAAGEDLVGTATLSHKVPDAPVIVSPQPGETVNAALPVVIDWNPVSDPRGGKITGYQVIVGSFSVTLPATKTHVTVPPEFLDPGTEYLFEVLAIEAGCDGAIAKPIGPQLLRERYGLLLPRLGCQLLANNSPSEGPSATKIFALFAFFCLYIADPLCDAVSFELSERGDDGKKNSTDSISADVSA